MDAYVTIDGTPLQKSFRPDMRPLNREEIARTLQVGLCLPCHLNISDPAYNPYDPKKACQPFWDEQQLNNLQKNIKKVNIRFDSEE